MKGFSSIFTFVLSTLFITDALAEESAEQASYSAQDADMYIEEIRSTCMAEAEGMDEAETYISECIKNMKLGFTESN